MKWIYAGIDREVYVEYLDSEGNNHYQLLSDLEEFQAPMPDPIHGGTMKITGVLIQDERGV